LLLFAAFAVPPRRPGVDRIREILVL